MGRTHPRRGLAALASTESRTLRAQPTDTP
jgi:hypothetical protein